MNTYIRCRSMAYGSSFDFNGPEKNQIKKYCDTRANITTCNFMYKVSRKSCAILRE